MEPIIIAIDGTAASGKGTLAKMLAERLNFAYLDTGKLYRYIGYKTLESGKNPENERDALIIAHQAKAHMTENDLSNPTLANDIAGKAASQVAIFPTVRNALKNIQINFALHPPGNKKGAILDGRDIGTIICPEASVKFYIDASTEIRAKRRHKELQSKGISATYDAVLVDLLERDERDAGRDTAPMTAADNALIIDTSNLSIDEAFNKMLAHVLKEAKI